MDSDAKRTKLMDGQPSKAKPAASSALVAQAFGSDVRHLGLIDHALCMC